jgi:hypothetical protein
MGSSQAACPIHHGSLSLNSELGVSQFVRSLLDHRLIIPMDPFDSLCYQSAHFEEAVMPLCHMGHDHPAGLVKEPNLVLDWILKILSPADSLLLGKLNYNSKSC